MEVLQGLLVYVMIVLGDLSGQGGAGRRTDGVRGVKGWGDFNQITASVSFVRGADLVKALIELV